VIAIECTGAGCPIALRHRREGVTNIRLIRGMPSTCWTN